MQQTVKRTFPHKPLCKMLALETVISVINWNGFNSVSDSPNDKQVTGIVEINTKSQKEVV